MFLLQPVILLRHIARMGVVVNKIVGEVYFMICHSHPESDPVDHLTSDQSTTFIFSRVTTSLAYYVNMKRPSK